MLHDLSETWWIYQDKKTIRERLDINVWLYQDRWAEQVEHQQALLVRWIDMDVSTFLYDVDKHRLTPSHTRRLHHRHVVAKLGWPRKGNFQATL